MACKKHTDSTYFRKAIMVRPDETIANIAITLNRQTDSLPRKLIDHLKTEFLTHGGIKRRDVCRTQRMAQTEPIIST